MTQSLNNAYIGDALKEVGIPPRLRNRVRNLIARLETSHLPLPTIVPTSSGAIVMAWSSYQRDLLLIFSPDELALEYMTIERIRGREGETIDQLRDRGKKAVREIDPLLAWYLLGDLQAAEA